MSEVRKRTKRRLLEAAREVFSENGYEAATVQMIATRSQANIAAVNYHYGSKAGLYAAMVSAEMEELASRMPQLSDAEGEPEGQLRKYIAWFYERYEPGSVLRDFNRELLLRVDDFQPFFIEQVVTREWRAAEEIIRALLPAGTSMVKVRRWVRATMALCTGPVLGTQIEDLSGVNEGLQEGDSSRDPDHFAGILLNALEAERSEGRAVGGKKKKKRKSKEKTD